MNAQHTITSNDLEREPKSARERAREEMNRTKIKSIEKCACLDGIDLVRTKGCTLQSTHGLTTSSLFVIDMVVAFFALCQHPEREKIFFLSSLFEIPSAFNHLCRDEICARQWRQHQRKTATLNCYNCITSGNIHFFKINLSIVIHYCSDSKGWKMARSAIPSFDVNKKILHISNA